MSKKAANYREAQRLSDRYRPHHRKPESRSDSVGEALADTPLRGRPFPRNFRTGKPYRGINIMLFGLAATARHSGLRSIRPKS